MITFTFFTLASCHVFASDLTDRFKQLYHQEKELNSEEQNLLRQHDIYFIPGIFAESLILSDPRSSVDFSIITKDYFHAQLKLLNKKYKIPAKRLVTSSYDVNETKRNIRKAIAEAQANGRKVIFVSHSLGGLVLLEELILNPSQQSLVGGIAFLQSPFQGTPLGELALNPPFELQDIMNKLLPRVNISEETLLYVSPESRKKFMKENRPRIRDFINNIPMFTLAGKVEGNKSIFKPLIDILADGCLKSIRNKCVTEVFFQGPYDESDGLVPLKSSYLQHADSVTLDQVDHGEFILNIPFEDYQKEQFTNVLFKLLLSKIDSRK